MKGRGKMILSASLFNSTYNTFAFTLDVYNKNFYYKGTKIVKIATCPACDVV